MCSVRHRPTPSAPSATGFIPFEDNGYFFVDVALPDGAALGRTEAVVSEIEQIMLADPDIENVLSVSGFSLLAGSRASGGLLIAILKHWDDRTAPEQRLGSIIARLQPQLFTLPQATAFAFPAPPIEGLGTAGGIEAELQDLGGRAPDELAMALQSFILRANEDPRIARAFSTWTAQTPQLFLDVDREQAETSGRADL